MKQDLNYIKRRLELLNETAKELKEVFKKTKLGVLEDLYLEIQCYTNQIQGRLKKFERREKWKNK